jgi:hypothetical protein
LEVDLVNAVRAQVDYRSFARAVYAYIAIALFKFISDAKDYVPVSPYVVMSRWGRFHTVALRSR